MERMPAVFVGHGSPMNAIQDNAYRRAWTKLGEELPRPKSILCVSAHWESRGVAVTAMDKPRTIHDFGGFPQALFDVRYDAPGSPALAQRVAKLVPDLILDEEWGLDHGSWSVLVAMYPKADIPVVQLSLDTSQVGAFHLELAKKLAPLRDEGVLILGSGNIVHNLPLFSFRHKAAHDWAARFDAKAKELIKKGDHDALADYESLGPDAMLSTPTPEHYFPLLYALGAKRKGETVRFFNEEVETAISMTSVVVG